MIRLNNQARKRAKLAQKFEETKSELLSEPLSSDLNKNFQNNQEEIGNSSNVKEQENWKSSIENVVEDSNQNVMETPEVKSKNETPLAISVEIHQNSASSDELESNSAKSNGEVDAKAKESKRYAEMYCEEEPTDHLYPMEVDVSDVIGTIVQVIT